MECKQGNITRTCRELTRAVYTDQQTLATKRIRTMTPTKKKAIRRKCSILETCIHI